MGVLKRNRRTEQGIEGRIRHEIEHLVPLLHIDACQIRLVRFEPATGLALLRIEGGCSHCDMSAVTLLQGIEAHLRRSVPEIREVRALDSDDSPDA